MADMFGAPIGLSRGERDRNDNLLTGLKAADMLSELSMAPIKAQHMQAQTELAQATAGQKKFELEATRKWSEASARLSALGSDADPVENMFQRGFAAIEAGLPEQGTRLINAARQVRTGETTQVANLALAARREALIVKEQAEQLGNMAASVTDQASLDLMRLEANSRGIDVSQIPARYEEAVPKLKFLHDSSIDAAERARLQLQEIDKREQGATRRGQQRLNEVTTRLRELQAERERKKIDTMGKVGGKGYVASPKRDDVTAAKKLLEKEGDLFLADDDLAIAGQAIASRANVLMKQNPGIKDINEARMRAIAEARRDGDLVPGKPGLELGGLLGGKIGATKGKFTAAGKIPQTAIATVPQKPAERQAGRYYQTPKGVYQWTKDGWARPAQGLLGPISGEDDEDDD